MQAPSLLQLLILFNQKYKNTCLAQNKLLHIQLYQEAHISKHTQTNQ